MFLTGSDHLGHDGCVEFGSRDLGCDHDGGLLDRIDLPVEDSDLGGHAAPNRLQRCRREDDNEVDLSRLQRTSAVEDVRGVADGFDVVVELFFV